jgi:glycosyltransferase involved in cell wall biosynthesis
VRIGINLLFLLPRVVGGSETYADGLLHTLPDVDARNEYVFFVNRESADWPLPEGARFSRVLCPVAATSRVRRYAFEQLRLPALLSRHSVDLVHSLGYVSPLRTPCPSVVTVHDLNYRAFGRQMPVVKRLALAFFVARSISRADKVITMSEATRRDILDAFGVPEDKVVVTHEAPKRPRAVAGVQLPFSAIGGRLGVSRPFMLAFSSSSPNKNIPRLLQAYAQAKRRDQLPHQLVLVGHAPEGASAEWTRTDGVSVTGYLDDETLRAVLSHAEMLVFPSFYEGFGLPILEAMEVGVPVVCSNRASLPEVAGEAAVFFDPFSVEDMAVQMARVAHDATLRDELRARGYRNLERFSWEKTASRTLDVYSGLVPPSL